MVPLLPQHHRVPVRIPHTACSSAAIALQSFAEPTRVGSDAGFVSPVPSCPFELSPQHHSEPSAWIAQKKPCPTATDLHAVAVPTCAGAELAAAFPHDHMEPSRLIAAASKAYMPTV